MHASSSEAPVLQLWPQDVADPTDESTTVTAILDAAFELFLDFGFRKVSIEDVARRAGVSRVTIYRHYAGKNDLFLAVSLRELRREIDDIEHTLDDLPPDSDIIVEALVMLLRKVRRGPLLRRILETEPEWLAVQATLEAADVLKLTTALAARFLRQPRFCGLFADEHIDTIAELFVRVLQSALLTPGGLLGSDDLDDLRRAFALLTAPLYRDNSTNQRSPAPGRTHP